MTTCSLYPLTVIVVTRRHCGTWCCFVPRSLACRIMRKHVRRCRSEIRIRSGHPAGSWQQFGKFDPEMREKSDSPVSVICCSRFFFSNLKNGNVWLVLFRKYFGCRSLQNWQCITWPTWPMTHVYSVLPFVNIHVPLSCTDMYFYTMSMCQGSPGRYSYFL